MKVLEKFRNKKVFILYLVGVLLLSTSVSFAYFTSRTNTSGNGSVAVGTTTVIESTGINSDGTIEFNNVDMYPGHTGIAGIKVTATGTTPMIYNVIFNGTNTFNTPLNYTVYKTTTEIDASYTCNKREERQGVNTYYYEECTGTNIGELGEVVSSGTIHTSEGKTTLLDSEIILGTEEGNIVYYYVVIEYPNEESNQNDDLGSTISGNITIEEGGEYTNPSISMIGTTVSGSNGWVKSASINANVTTQTGNYEALYCITTEDSCTPNTSANISDNSFSVTLNNNSSAQRVCVQVIDEYNQIASGCSEAYQVDGQIPTVTIASTSSTENSITVTVNGSDSHSGIYQYRFSSDNGSSYTDIDTTETSYTYTFNNLESGTSYNIVVQVVDEVGNVNSASRNIETESGLTAGEQILANKTIDTSRSGAITGVLTADTTGTVYSVADDYGTSYVYAGAPTDNWVRFAGFYWRIIRINGDGSIRMIYNGTSTATTGTSTQIQTSAYNSSYNDNAYVGYMYGSAGQSSYAPTHANNNNSTIKGILDTWYENNLRDDYAQYISTEAGFCNDRRIATSSETFWTSDTKRGYGTNTTAYAPFSRFLTTGGGWDSTQTPTLECSQESSDLFTVSGSSKGNHELTYPIGLITADEVVLAGGFGGTVNQSYYLYTGQYYWTMSPGIYYFRASVFLVYSNGPLTNLEVNNSYGVRPVINLSPDVQISGAGTTSDPYTVVGAS